MTFFGRIGTVAVIALVACSGTPANPPPPPGPPTLVSRFGLTGGAGMFGGNIYAGTGDAAGTFEVDTPMHTPAGVEYFAFTLSWQVTGLATLEVAWAPDNSGENPVSLIASPCDESMALFAEMQGVSAQQTGRRGPASFAPAVDQRIEAGEAMWFVTCGPDSGGEHIDTARGMVTTEAAFLIPAALIARGGSLRVTGRNSIGGALGPATNVPIAVSPQWVAAVGDSVVWGQGVESHNKAYARLAAAVERAHGPTAPVVVAAHSGAVLRTEAAHDAGINRIADVDTTECPTNREINGEVPRANPSIQCQVRSITETTCSVPVDQLGVVPIPDIRCGDDAPGPGDLATFAVDVGPRYDFVLMDACINDLEARKLLTGPEYTFDLDSKVTEKCDLRNGVADLRTFLPNADIEVIGYHLIVDSQSDPYATGCFPVVPCAPCPPCLDCPPVGPCPPEEVRCPPCVDPPDDCIPTPLELATPVLLAQLLAGATRQAMVGRAERFQGVSDAALRDSVAAIAQSVPLVGRGRVSFVSLAPQFGPGTGMLSTNTLLWGLACGQSPFGPQDPVAGPRADACIAFHDPVHNADPLSLLSYETCLRASAFHPDDDGHSVIFELVRQDLVAAGRL